MEQWFEAVVSGDRIVMALLICRLFLCDGLCDGSGSVAVKQRD
jgi:hypothetical protein